MITNVRKFGDAGGFAPVETEGEECACCEAALSVVWVGAGVVFFEEEGGPIRRVENLGLTWPLAFLCKEVTADEARAELAETKKGSSRS